MTFLKGGRMLTPPTEFLNSDILKFHFDFSFSFGSQVASVLRTLLRLRCFPMWIEPYMKHLCCAT